MTGHALKCDDGFGTSVAEVDPKICGSCLICMDVCEPRCVDIDGLTMAAKVNQEHCNGCGECEANCTSGAIAMVSAGPIRKVG